MRVFLSCNKIKMAYHHATFFIIKLKTIRKYGKIHTHLIYLEGRNLIIITQ